ncbi:helicase [candidate division WWE3 bacterium]|nr:helicase [candidate division WWE3 bacterium]
MSIIDNTDQSMHQALVNALSTADSIDIEVGYFYFSGWRLLAKHLKDKKIRILVGKYIDPNAVPELLSRIKQEGPDVDLNAYQPRHAISSRLGRKQTYVDSFIKLSNESSLFDDTDAQEAYKILEKKIEDGSLEIKISETPLHGKMYILHKKPKLSESGDLPGTVFMGSSNFTFQGLVNQGELNRRDSNKAEYLEYVKKFEEHWKDANNIDVASLENREEFLENLKKDLWIHAVPNPYAIYIRVLHELFGKEETGELETPHEITKDRYTDLKYQIDAIRSLIQKLKKYDGAILADVVGLGKSVIASAAAYNMDLRTLIIAPPHLKNQWEDYQSEFKLPGASVYSSGKVEQVYEKYKNNDQPLLIIVDEAHRYRNEDTNNYRMLHHICNSHPDNKIVLLTATPFNNDPKDVFALIKLFQIPGKSTIQSVDNLSFRFRELIERYRKLNKYRRREDAEDAYINNEADAISKELRRLIENVVIRRSRLDLRAITRYREDLEKQNIDFAGIEGPTLITYELGDLLDLYLDTLLKITGAEEDGGFVGARYKPTNYIKADRREDFLAKYGEDFDETDLKTAQSNLAKFMKRLLVMRFESSKDAFRSTLENIITSTEVVENWWDTLGKVPIMKKGQIPDPDTLLETSADDIESEVKNQISEEEYKELKETKGLITVPKDMLEEKFIQQVRQDKQLLQEIHSKWFDEKSIDIDPKLDEVYNQIKGLLENNPERKIVIFSTYADTVNYLAEEFINKGQKRVLKYTAADSNKSMKQTIRENFDAGLREENQENEYDILITTDALSEGYNLHRAGVVINYDIPYNPTRVIQRIGRINRINKKVFDKLHIYNCFPTETGESEIRIKQISTLKMQLINAVIGSDTKTLTKDEELQSFFKDEYNKAQKATEYESWDAKYREEYDQARRDKDLFKQAMEIKPRSRVIRENKEVNSAVAFGKKGDHAVFGIKQENQEPNIVDSATALKYFKAERYEEGKEADKQYDEVFKVVRDLLWEKPPIPPVRGRRSDALKVIKYLEENLPKAKDYCKDIYQIIKKYDGINEGDLKSIAQLPLEDAMTIEDFEELYVQIKEIVPQHQITSINRRATRLEGEYEMILLSEDLRT